MQKQKRAKNGIYERFMLNIITVVGLFHFRYI